MKRGKKCKCSDSRGKMLSARRSETLEQIVAEIYAREELIARIENEVIELKEIRDGLEYYANKKQSRRKRFNK